MSFVYYRGNNITSLKELQKLQALPMLRALVLSGMTIKSILLATLIKSWTQFMNRDKLELFPISNHFLSAAT